MYLGQEYHRSDAMILYAIRWHTVSICAVNDDVYFDHLIKTVSDWHLCYRVTVFPFLLNKYFVGEAF